MLCGEGCFPGCCNRLQGRRLACHSKHPKHGAQVPRLTMLTSRMTAASGVNTAGRLVRLASSRQQMTWAGRGRRGACEEKE